MDTTATGTGWWLSGFQSIAALWAWAVLVLLYAMWRSLRGGEPDPLRDSGPVD